MLKKHSVKKNQEVDNSNLLWDEIGRKLDWIKPYTKIQDTSFDLEDFRIRWYEDGTLNVCYNCVDRHLPHRANDIAIIWEPNDSKDTALFITYQDLYVHVSKMANTLKKLGVEKGDRVVLYMPMIPEAAYAMLACARIGAIHSVVFGGFSAKAIAERIDDSRAKLLITSDFSKRGHKNIPLKKVTDEAVYLSATKSIKSVLVIKNTGGEVPMASHDHWYHEAALDVPDKCPVAEMRAEDPLFILYTSGSTGKPKGVLHTSGGYLAYAAYTHERVFGYKPGDIYWCTADIGWITGHSYIVYGPLANGATTLMFEGVPTFPSPARCWEIVDRHHVHIFYTSPTAIRALEKEGNQYLEGTHRQSLKLMGSVGEPLNPEAWQWYYNKVGHGKSPIVDTWWQTETGGILMSPLPFNNCAFSKPGSVKGPLPGIQVALLNSNGEEIEGSGSGYLVVKDSWPGQMRGIYGDQSRFIETYFTEFPGTYTTGDGAKRDSNGDYWITGRIDDVINVSGHRIGSAEVEYALNNHPKIAESAVVGFSHPIKGQGIHAFVLLMSNTYPGKNFNKEVIALLRQEIGPLVRPDKISVVTGLPKTRSGKIMRRILQKISEGEDKDFGDITTLADPSVIQTILDSEKLNINIQ